MSKLNFFLYTSFVVKLKSILKIMGALVVKLQWLSSSFGHQNGRRRPKVHLYPPPQPPPPPSLLLFPFPPPPSRYLYFHFLSLFLTNSFSISSSHTETQTQTQSLPTLSHPTLISPQWDPPMARIFQVSRTHLLRWLHIHYSSRRFLSPSRRIVAGRGQFLLGFRSRQTQPS